MNILVLAYYMPISTSYSFPKLFLQFSLKTTDARIEQTTFASGGQAKARDDRTTTIVVDLLRRLRNFDNFSRHISDPARGSKPFGRVTINLVDLFFSPVSTDSSISQVSNINIPSAIFTRI